MAHAAIVSLAVLGLTPGDEECSPGNQLLIISGQQPQPGDPAPPTWTPEVGAGGSGGEELREWGARGMEGPSVCAIMNPPCRI